MFDHQNCNVSINTASNYNEKLKEDKISRVATGE
jgi:hypothetical protein